MSTPRRLLTAFAGLLLVVAPRTAGAQTAPATLTVVVCDPAGGPVAGASIRILQWGQPVAGGTTDTDGRMRMTGLAPRPAVVEVTQAGFRAMRVEGLALAAEANLTLPVRLSPGGFTDAVLVTSARLAGPTDMPVRLDGDRLRATPSLDRDVTAATLAAVGTAPPAPGSRLSTQGNAGLVSGGAREAANAFRIDGLDDNDLFINRLAVTPGLDALDAIVVRQVLAGAEFGQQSGATVDLQVRSGTSDRRVSAYEYYRPSPRHLFGGSFGGPLPRTTASFVFVNAEGLTGRETDRRDAHVPTLAERAGDFRASGVTLTDPVSGRPFPDLIIPAPRISPIARRLLDRLPAPTAAGQGVNLTSAPDARQNGATVTAKTDHRAGAAQVSVRYVASRDTRVLPYVARNRNIPDTGLETRDAGQTVAAGLSHAWTPRVFHRLRAGVTWTRRDNLAGGRDADGLAALGIRGPAVAPLDFGVPSFAVAGLETIGDDSNLPVTRQTRAWHVADTITVDLGRHQLKAGGDARTYRSDGVNHLFARGKLTFSGAFTGSGLGDLLLGLPSVTLLGSNDNPQALRTWSVSGFVEDTWRPAARLTVTAGLRYEFRAPPVDARDRMHTFDPATRTMVRLGTGDMPRAGVDADRNDWAPRTAVSVDLTGHGRTIARAGYGLYYDTGTLIEHSAFYFNPPEYALQVFVPTATALLTLADPWPSGRALTPLPSVNMVARGFRTAHTHQAVLGLEHTAAGATLTARYVGTVGRSLARKRNINQPVPGPGPLDPRRPIPGFGDILVVESAARSTYHALQLALDRPLRGGLEAHAAYTWSRSFDDASAFLATDGNDNTPQDSRNLAAEWGPSDFDVRHRAVVSVIWTPAARAWLWRDWQVAALVSAQSGRPFTPRLSTDNSNTGNTGGATFASDRPDVVPVGHGLAAFGGAGFAIPARYTFGTAGRNSLRGPGSLSVDVSVGRRWTRGDRRTLDVRLEAFNVFDRRNGALPDSFVDHATFGQSLSAAPGRQWQIVGRLGF